LTIQALEEVQMEGLERDILREICQGNQRGDQEEPVAKAARELWQAASKTVQWSAPRNGWRKKDYSSSEARSMFPGTWTCEGEWSPYAMIQRLPDTLNAGKRWS